MTIDALKELNLPDAPGVYRFCDAHKKILYIGKATSLKDRVRSYFSNDVLHTRGKHIADMVVLASTVTFEVTDSVLEALILEASLIKRHQPYFNTKEKDDKSWNYVVITKEEYPRVFVIRERTMLIAKDTDHSTHMYVFGPFPQGGNLKEALTLVRKIFPFRSDCVPLSGKPCFNRQIGLCPGVCTGEIGVVAYRKRIQEIKLFFQGKKSKLVSELTKNMKQCATQLLFEEAGEYKRMLRALEHINDVTLIREEVRTHSQQTAGTRRKPFRIEAYDVAHISGTHTVGVMTVLHDGEKATDQYRKFKIRIAPNMVDDTLHLAEILRRRFAHTTWQMPDIVVVDGGKAQKRSAENVLQELGISASVLSVLKDDRHKAKAILGPKELGLSYKRQILLANLESHRSALRYHRQLRERLPT